MVVINSHKNTGRSKSAINRPQCSSSPQIVGATWKSVVRKGRWLMENVLYLVACWALSAIWTQEKPEWNSASPFFFHPRENWKGRSNFGKKGSWIEALLAFSVQFTPSLISFIVSFKAFVFFQLKWVVENKVQYFTSIIYQMVFTAWKHSSAICKVVFDCLKRQAAWIQPGYNVVCNFKTVTFILTHKFLLLHKKTSSYSA